MAALAPPSTGNASSSSSPVGVDIVTVENLATKLPQWDAKDVNQLYALVDMGSNGIRFSISDLTPPHARLLRCVYQERAPISLLDALLEGTAAGGGGGGSDGDDKQKKKKAKSAAATTTATNTRLGGGDVFPAETVAAVSKTLARFRAIALDGHGVAPRNMSVFATEAMRRASNAAEMLDAIRAAAPDLEVHVLEPRVETLLGAIGARSQFVRARGLFLDLGGGSLQVSYVDTGEGRGRHELSSAGGAAPAPMAASEAVGAEGQQHSYAVAAAIAGQSLPFGAARMTHIIEHMGKAAIEEEVGRLRDGLAAALARLKAIHPLLAADLHGEADETDTEKAKKAKGVRGVDLYLYGGGFRGYGSMLMFNDPIKPYPFAGVGGYTVSGAYFAETKAMRKVNKKHDGKIPGMSSRRRHQFPAIATVVEALVAVIPKVRTVVFCAGGNREGALMMSLPEAVRESSPLDLLLPAVPKQQTPNQGPDAGAATDVIASLLIEALPESLAEEDNPVNVFSLGLGRLFAQHLVPPTVAAAGDNNNTSPARPGSGDDHGGEALLRASDALHHSLGRDTGAPGLGHLERAVLAVTLVARWGGEVPTGDEGLLERLRAVVAAAAGGGESKEKGEDNLFWADYIGAVAAALGKVLSAWPRDLLAAVSPGSSPAAVSRSPLASGEDKEGEHVGIRFRASTVGKFGKEVISLDIELALPPAVAADAGGFDAASLTAPFKRLGRPGEGCAGGHARRKVVASVRAVEPWG